jgi:hypothetical protein
MRNDQRADGVVAGASTGVADNVSIPFLETSKFGGIEPRIHAGEDRKAAGGRQREAALVSEFCRIGLICGQDFVENLGHRMPPEKGLTDRGHPRL